jgi:hypothetical protein
VAVVLVILCVPIVLHTRFCLFERHARELGQEKEIKQSRRKPYPTIHVERVGDADCILESEKGESNRARPKSVEENRRGHTFATVPVRTSKLTSGRKKSVRIGIGIGKKTPRTLATLCFATNE